MYIIVFVWLLLYTQRMSPPPSNSKMSSEFVKVISFYFSTLPLSYKATILHYACIQKPQLGYNTTLDKNCTGAFQLEPMVCYDLKQVVYLQ